MAARYLINWPVPSEVVDGRVDVSDEPEGLSASDRAGLERDMDEVPMRLSLAHGSIGKGAEALALTLVVEVERVVNDAASLLAVGAALRQLIRHVKQRRRGRLGRAIISDPETLIALAAAETPGLTRTEWSYFSPRLVCLVGSPGVGTDERDIYAAVFSDERSGKALVTFMSPSGLCLGSVLVPAEVYLTDQSVKFRERRDIDRWWVELGGSRG